MSIHNLPMMVPMNPRLDQLGPNQRLQENTPLVAAYLGGRPVILARPDDRGGPSDLSDRMIPLTISRMRRAIDIEGGRATGPYVPSLVDDVPLDMQFSGIDTVQKTILYGMIGGSFLLGAGVGVVLGLLFRR